MEFGKYIPVNVRELWPHEERDFTPWLANHLGELADILGLEMDFVGREIDVGGFFVDIVAQETGSGRYVIIENQFGASDHDHLGKLITYAGGKQASILVWIAERIRDEHRQALEWLNEHSRDDTLVFGIELAAFRIDSSKPVFQFRPVVQPNDWARSSRRAQSSEGLSDTKKAYQSFFQRLIDDLREKHRFTTARLGQPQSWYSFSGGGRGVRFGAWFGAGRRLTAEIYLDGGDREDNKRRFDALVNFKDVIEKKIGGELIWERLDTKQACRICVRRDGAIADSEEQLDQYRNWLIDQLLRLRNVWQQMMLEIVVASDNRSAQEEAGAELRSSDLPSDCSNPSSI